MILSILTNLFIWSGIYWLFKLSTSGKKRESMYYSIQKGLVCQNCKEDIHIDLNTIDKLEAHYTRLSDNKEYHTLCTSYKRDIALDTILENPISKIKKVIFNKWKRNYIIFVCISLLFQLLGMIQHLSFLGLIGGIVLFFTNWGNYKNFLMNSRPKKTQS